MSDANYYGSDYRQQVDQQQEFAVYTAIATLTEFLVSCGEDRGEAEAKLFKAVGLKERV